MAYLPEKSYFQDNRDANGYVPFGTPISEYMIGDDERRLMEQDPQPFFPMYDQGVNDVLGSAARFNQRISPNPTDALRAMNEAEQLARINQYGSTARANQHNTLNDVYGNDVNNTANKSTLGDILNSLFGGNVAQANPAPTPPVSERHPKGFARPYVMSLQEYQDNYLPYYGLNYQDIPQQELPRQFNRMSNPDRDY